MKNKYLIIAIVLFLCHGKIFTQENLFADKTTNLKFADWNENANSNKGKTTDIRILSKSGKGNMLKTPPAPGGDALLYCEFKEGIPSDWDNWNMDGLSIHPENYSNNDPQRKTASLWVPYYYTPSRSVAASFSFLDPNGQADDWLVTPSVSIPSDNSSYEVSWDAMTSGAQPQYYESYEVRTIENNLYEEIINKKNQGQYANNTEFSNALQQASTLLKFVDPEYPQWATHKISLDAYKAKNIRLIWRNNTNNKTAILISSVKVNKSIEEPETGLNENFRENELPEEWERNGDPKVWRFWKDFSSSMVHNGNMIMKGYYVYFDSYQADKFAEGGLVTPPFTPSQNYHILYYEVQQYLMSDFIPGPGAQVYIDVSTNNGVSYHQSTENILENLENFNRTGNNTNFSTDITPMRFNLEEYIGKEIRVRFRAVSDDGAFIYAFTNIKLVDPPVVADLSLSVDKFDYTMVPYRQADFTPKAKITNYGKKIEEGDAIFQIETNSSYNQESDIPELASYHYLIMESPNIFTTKEVGVKKFKYSLEVENDSDPSDNTVEDQMEITTNIYATDNGIIDGGFGSNRENFILTCGNLFLLKKRDIITAIQVAFNGVEDEPYSFLIFDKAQQERIYTSPVLHKPTDIIKGEFITYELEEPICLEPGEYLLAITQEGKYLNVGVDGNLTAGGVFYQLSNIESFKNTMYLEQGKGRLMLRGIFTNGLNDMVSHSPDAGEKNVELKTKIEVVFTDEVKINNKNGITLNGKTLAESNITANNNILIIDPVGLNGNTRYDVVISEDAIQSFETGLKWSFITKDDNSIADTEIKNIKIYPTISNGEITIDAEMESTVKVIDLSGRHLVSYFINGKSQLILNYQNGVYIVVVENAAGTHSSKIIIQR